MLAYLKVEQFALIESTEVEFRFGFNALTGETGAGKTVLVGAIGLLLGERGDAMQVRSGAPEARLECVYDLSMAPEALLSLQSAGYIEAGETKLVLTRTVSHRARGRCTVNGRLAPVSALAGIGEVLVEIHGQNTHQALLRSATHTGYLDRFTGGAHLAALEQYRECYGRLRALRKEREALEGRGGDIAREAGLLRHEIAEIDAVGVQPGGIEVLEEEAGRLRNEKELTVMAADAREALSGGPSGAGAVLQTERALADIRKMAGHDRGLEALADRLESASYELEDLSTAIDRYAEQLGSKPGRLEEVESRLSELRRLSRRFGGTLEAVADYREEAASRLEALEAAGVRLAAVSEEERSAEAEAAGLAEAVSHSRESSARRFSAAVLLELEALELSGAAFVVSVSGMRGEADREEGEVAGARLGPDGKDSVEFLFSPEPSVEPRPLAKITSGGEMSRVMLAVKMVLAGADRIPVLVFDEVDSGIGGETAVRTGEKLRALSAHHQVFCVTHLPQIASFAEWQYRVRKTVADGGALTGIELLEGGDRVSEVCRMLGDSSGREATLEHARDLLERSGGHGARG